MALALRADQLIASGDFTGAVDQIDALLTLDRGSSSAAYVDVLQRLMDVPAAREAIIAKLDEQPDWGGTLLRRINQTSNDFRLLLALNKGKPVQGQIVVNRLLNDSGPEAAFLAWSEVTGVDLANVTWPYDGTFLDSDSPGPFNWTHHREFAERAPGGGMDIYYPGRRPLSLARQTMLLGPGTYSIAVQAEGARSRGDGPQLELSLSCEPRNILFRTSLAWSPSTEVTTQTFEVPVEGCSSQRVEITGKPGVNAEAVRARIKRVSITASRVTSGELR